MSTRLEALERAKAEVEAHKKRRRAEKMADLVAKGEAVFAADPFVIINGIPCRKKENAALAARDAQGRQILYDEEPTIIFTGVPRQGDTVCPDCDGNCASRYSSPANL